MIIYKTTNLLNGKIYVGFHKTDKEDGYLGSGKAILKAIKKYGKENFKRETLEIVNENNWEEREKFWISELKAQDKSIGYNICEGGNKGPTMYGKDNPSTGGKLWTEQLRKEQSIRQKERMSIKENRDKCAFNKGRKFPQSVRDNMSKARKGEGNSFFGKEHSVESKNLISGVKTKYKGIIIKEGKRYEFNSKMDWNKFCEQNNINGSSAWALAKSTPKKYYDITIQKVVK